MIIARILLNFETRQHLQIIRPRASTFCKNCANHLLRRKYATKKLCNSPALEQLHSEKGCASNLLPNKDIVKRLYKQFAPGNTLSRSCEKNLLPTK